MLNFLHCLSQSAVVILCFVCHTLYNVEFALNKVKQFNTGQRQTCTRNTILSCNMRSTTLKLTDRKPVQRWHLLVAKNRSTWALRVVIAIEVETEKDFPSVRRGRVRNQRLHTGPDPLHWTVRTRPLQNTRLLPQSGHTTSAKHH